MKLTPWRERTETPASLNDWWDRFFSFGNGGEVSRPLSNLPEVFRRTPFPVMNVAETENSFDVTVELPGLDEDDIQVGLMGNQLTVSGERKWEEKKEDKEFRHVESQYGSFQRSFMLPEGVRCDAKNIYATFKNGILQIVLPKTEPTLASKIKVKKG